MGRYRGVSKAMAIAIEMLRNRVIIVWRPMRLTYQFHPSPREPLRNILEIVQGEG